MQLLDYSQITISALMAHVGGQAESGAPINEDLVRHTVLNSIRSSQKRFKNTYGDMIICCDDKHYWRKTAFQYYKAHRQKDRAQSAHDWNAIFESLNKIRDEVRDNFPYKMIQVPHAEADDVIATLCKQYGTFKMTPETERILIISGDKDFGQLQKYVNVEQYSPLTKKFIVQSNPERLLREHIIYGDRGDGVPNIFSDDDSIINENKRQRNVSRKFIEPIINFDEDYFISHLTSEQQLNYYRNKSLIDLEEIPENIRMQILDKYILQIPPTRETMLEYLKQHNLRVLLMNEKDF